MPASAEPGTTVGRVAEAYARTRPPYSRAAIERAADELGLTSDARVLDLGAGTGNLTRTLREVFADVVAVEPDAQMRVLNKRFRRIDRTTDVLSFGETIPARDRGAGAIAHINGRRAENGGRFDLGEILISPEQASRQARRRKRPVAAEEAFLAAHGVLHLLGYEDETPAGYREMVRLGHDAARQKSVNR